MAATREGRFAEALRRIDRRRLNAAFEHCNHLHDVDGYDRTALHRWLAGSVPGREDFVVRLAEELKDDTLVDAWRASRATTTATDVKAVVTRFAGLGADDKLSAFHEIREELAASASVPVRRNFRMRVELHDGPPAAGADNRALGPYRMRVAIDWDGYLPANANTVIVTDYDRLGHAFDQDNCLFRDVVELDESFLSRTRSLDGAVQSLSYGPLDGNGRTTTIAATEADGGVYQFDNPECADARVRLRVEYPFPHGTAFYPIVFQGYQIDGPARITIVLYSATAENPRGYAFLGQGRSWQASQLMPRELELEVGSEGSTLGDETGIVLYWSEMGTGVGVDAT